MSGEKGHPLVSVVIPTYNAPQLLMETLESVFAQTMTDYEVLVINDGSTDDTAQRLEPLAKSGRIRLINQANGGIGAARNRGIDESRGRYIAFLDHDDLWLPGKLRVQVEFMASRPECVACAVPWAFIGKEGGERPMTDVARLVDAEGRVIRPLRQLAHGQVFLISSALMVRREGIGGLRYGERRGCIEDQPFQIGLFARGKFGIAGRDVLMRYRWHGQNYSSQSEYTYHGIKMLRAMEASGAFAELRGEDREDLRAFLAHQARTATINQLRAGWRSRTVELYLREAGHQLREGRFKFLLTAPLLTLLPTRVVDKVFKGVQ